MRPKRVVVFLAIIVTTINTLTPDLIVNYFNHKFLQVGSVFTCLSKKDEIRFAKNLKPAKLRLSFFNVYDKNALIKSDGQSRLGMVLHGNCPNITSFLKTCEQKNLFENRQHWLIITSSNQDVVLNELKHIQISINTDINVAVLKNALKKNWTILDVYNPSYAHGGELKIRNIGYYNEMKGFQIRDNGHIYENRRNMTGTVFKAMVVLAYPFKPTLDQYLVSDVNRSVDSYNRFAHIVLQHCRDFYNFSMKTVMTKSWGYRASNDTPFDGLVGALHKKKVDFGSSLFLKTERLPFIDYSRRVWFLKTAFVFRIPKLKTSLSKFIETLSASVWMFTVLLIFIVVVQFKLVLKLECNVVKNLRKLCENTWSSLTLLTIGVICQQGTPRILNLYCGRILLLTIFIFSLLLYQFYSGTIVSYLLTSPSSTIRSLNDILTSNMKVGCEDLLYNKDFFRQTTDPVIKKLYMNKIVNKNRTNYMPPAEGLWRVSKGNFAYHVDLTTAYQIIEETFSNDQICELGEMQMLNYQNMFVSMQKGSPFRKILNFCIQKMTESGLIQRGFHFWQSRKPACLKKTFNTISIGLNEFYPAIVLLAIAVSLSVTILVAEIITHVHRNP